MTAFLVLLRAWLLDGAEFRDRIGVHHPSCSRHPVTVAFSYDEDGRGAAMVSGWACDGGSHLYVMEQVA